MLGLRENTRIIEVTPRESRRVIRPKTMTINQEYAAFMEKMFQKMDK